jgi:hypothetical protein
MTGDCNRSTSTRVCALLEQEIICVCVWVLVFTRSEQQLMMIYIDLEIGLQKPSGRCIWIGYLRNCQLWLR